MSKDFNEQMKLISLITIILLTSCSKLHKPVDTSVPLDEIKSKRDRYVELAKETVDEFGWLSPKCDGLLFNCLAAYSGFPVDPLKAEKEPGLWERHPGFDCMGNGSASTISKDMMRGLILYLFTTGRLDKIQAIKDYCDSHEVLGGTSCVIGEALTEEAYWGRVVLTPAMRSQIKRMLDKSPKESEAESFALKSGFEAHLDVLSIYTDYKIDGGLSAYDVEKLKAYSDASPRNALYKILANKFTGNGDQWEAISVLLDESLFPSELPTDQTRYTHYLWQRDDDEDWKPCGSSDKRPCEGITHAGIDLMFAVKLLEE